MPHAIVLRHPGDASALRMEEISVGEPGPGEVRVRQTAVGVNFHDIYVRNGLYKTLPLPGVPGIEAAGLVTAVGPGVDHVRVGDRIGYVTASYGAYASERTLPAALAIKLPPGLDDRTAASVLVRGLTVEMLTRVVHRVQPGNRVLVHAAGSGVGRMLCQKLRDIGVQVIGTAGSDEKAAAARAAGCEQVIFYRNEDFVPRVREITQGRGVDVAYDSVGKDTFMGSLECLGFRGNLVNYGQASGPVPPFEVSRLATKSNTVSRPIVFHYLVDRAERDSLASGLFDALARGVLTMEHTQVLPLADAGAAHQQLENRTATGPIVLLP
ncbi:MAG TPA: quinone oxidoreductase [Rhodopila sp.]|nr:quinone oxidoreductase [Rhodopila sp.]